MPSAEPVSLPSSQDLQRPFAHEEAVQRIGRLAELRREARILELGRTAKSAGLLLASELGCEVLVGETEDAGVQAIRARVQSEKLTDQVDVQKVDLEKLPFLEGAFDAIVSLDRRILPFDTALERLRPFLRTRGKLCLTYPVRVGRHADAAQVQAFEKVLGEKLRLPYQLLSTMERCGFEPEWVESLSDGELDQLYASGVGTKDPALAAELAMHREQGGMAHVSFALVMGRRKEPGEKPPVSRDRG